jgi:transforming growth factor-beta-induced protein
MKKISSSTTKFTTNLLLGTLLSVGLVACNTSDTADTSDTENTEVSTTTSTDTSTANDAAPMTQGKTIVTITQEDSEFSTLNQLLTQAGLTETLNSGEYTVFAPTNAAFEAVPKATMDKLSQNPELLKEVLMYHVVANKVPASEVITMTETQPLRNGAGIMITASGETVMLNNSAHVTRTDVMADNGVVHVIDQVLIPSDLTL